MISIPPASSPSARPRWPTIPTRVLAEMNARYAVIKPGGRILIGIPDHYDPCLDRKHLLIMRVGDFKLALANRIIWVPDENGQPVPVPLATWWLGHPYRRQHLGGVVLRARPRPRPGLSQPVARLHHRAVRRRPRADPRARAVHRLGRRRGGRGIPAQLDRARLAAARFARRGRRRDARRQGRRQGRLRQHAAQAVRRARLLRLAPARPRRQLQRPPLERLLRVRRRMLLRRRPAARIHA